MQTVQLSVDDEYKAIGDTLAGVIADVKAGKPITQDVMDALQNLAPAISSIGSMAADAKKADNQAYVAYVIAKAIEG